MEAKIAKEENDAIGVKVTDNNGAVHKLTLLHDGEVVYHEQNTYPDDATERDATANESVDSARDYAKWYVAQHREYDTVPWYLDTERLEQIQDLVSVCEENDLREHFWDYYRQLAGEYDRDITQPATGCVPRGSAMNEYREYKLDIYLDETETEIEITSGIHVMYYAAKGDDRLEKGKDPYPDRQPDGRLEHVVIDLDWAEFPEFLDYHLRCQIRDSYLARGEEPPEEYRVLGPGTDHHMNRQMHLDSVPEYYDYNASVDGYRAEDTFNAGPFGQILNLF